MDFDVGSCVHQYPKPQARLEEVVGYVTVDPLPALTLPRTSLESLEAATQMLISSLNLAATVDFCHAVLTRPMAGVGLSR